MSSQLLKDRFQALELVEIADNHLKLGQIEQAQENFARAFQIAQTFPNDIPKALPQCSVSVREQVLNAFIRSYAQVENYGSAVLVARGIEDEDFQACALSAIASQVAASGQADSALSIAQTIESNYYKAMALISISRSYGNTEQTSKAAEVLTQIIRIAWVIKNDPYPAWMLTHLSYYVQEKLGQLDTAFEIAQLVENDSDKAWILNRLARKYAKIGQFDRAIQIAEIIIDNEEKELALAWIADEYAKAGQSDAALKIVATIDNDWKNSPLIQIVKNYVASGQFEQAKEIAGMIKDPDDEDENDWKWEAMSDIAGGYAKAGQFDKALEFAENLENEYHKDEALWAIAYRYAELGQFESIIKMAPASISAGDDPLAVIAELMVSQELECDRIIAITKTLENEFDQRALLRSIIYQYANTENNSDKIIKFARSATDESIKYVALEHLAKSYVEAKDYDRVLEIAKSIGLEKVRVTSWKYIIPPS
ncbi:MULTISPECIES: tetratricopeptide repeat protein [unclassified Microcoleus]|uniref:tetratricopeptide repeat protein n=1 Tax=unclassified Microcoleus TaxID=2642155 RepID=UPI002FD74A48